jgi:hypothetical protein
VISASPQACGVGLWLAIATSICRKIATICFNIPFTDGHQKNRVFLNLLGTHWTYVKRVLDGNLEILNQIVSTESCSFRKWQLVSEFMERRIISLFPLLPR